MLILILDGLVLYGTNFYIIIYHYLLISVHPFLELYLSYLFKGQLIDSLFICFYDYQLIYLSILYIPTP